MSQALTAAYDGIILGAGQHGLVLGSYLAKAGLENSAGRAPAELWRRALHPRGHQARLLPQPAFDQSFPHQRDALVQGSRARRSVTYITPRYEFGQAHLDGTALVLGRDLDETVANIARFSKKDAATFREWNRKAEEITARILLPERYAEPLPQAEREDLLSRTALGRDFLEVTQRQPLDVVRGAVRERACEAAVPVQGVAVRHLADRHLVEDEPDGLGDPRLRPAKRLSALPGRLVQSGARADGDLHRRRRHVRAAGGRSTAS